MIHPPTCHRRAKRESRLVGCWPRRVALRLGVHSPASAADRPRVASINVCTDQLLLALADPEQILGLSPYSRDAARSWAAAQAARFRACRATPKTSWC